MQVATQPFTAHSYQTVETQKLQNKPYAPDWQALSEQTGTSLVSLKCSYLLTIKAQLVDRLHTSCLHGLLHKESICFFAHAYSNYRSLLSDKNAAKSE